MIPDHAWSTSRKSVEMKGRDWLRLREDTSCAVVESYVFTDGSSKGSYAAALVESGTLIRQEARFSTPTSAGSVGGEWKGYLLGLELAPFGRKVVVVSDLLWLHAWLIGRRKAVDPEIVHGIAQAKRLVESKCLDVVLVHHPGHGRGDDDFTKYNRLVDNLCREKNAEIEAASGILTKGAKRLAKQRAKAGK